MKKKKKKKKKKLLNVAWVTFVLTGLLEKITMHLNNNYILYDLQQQSTLRNNIDEFNPIFKSWNEVSQRVSTKYGTNGLGEMAF